MFDLSLAGELHNQSKYSDEMQIPNYHFIKSGMPQESREPVSELFRRPRNWFGHGGVGLTFGQSVVFSQSVPVVLTRVS